MIATVDKCHIGVLALLDLSAAFDTVDHVILMETLRRRFGVGGDALVWLADYLNGRRQVVCVASSETDMPLQYGIPQGSVLGPRIFTEYAEDVSDIFDHHAVTHHLFADDMQGQCGGPLNDASVMASRLDRCCSDVSDWYARKWL